MKTEYIELLKSVRDDSFKLGYLDGVKHANIDLEKRNEALRNDLTFIQKRANWLQNKLIRTKENYEGQVNNLLNKVNYYEDLLHRKKTEYIDTYTDMKGE